jgi:hypothetical protein
MGRSGVVRRALMVVLLAERHNAAPSGDRLSIALHHFIAGPAVACEHHANGRANRIDGGRTW